jgi:hypothetical protein
MSAPQLHARPRGQHDATLAEPRKAAVQLPEFGALEALEVPENARRAGREPPLFSLSGGCRAPSPRTPTMPAHGVGTPASASACLQPADGGEGSVFRGPARAPRGAGSRAWLRPRRQERCCGDRAPSAPHGCAHHSEQRGHPRSLRPIHRAPVSARLPRAAMSQARTHERRASESSNRERAIVPRARAH